MGYLSLCYLFIQSFLYICIELWILILYSVLKSKAMPLIAQIVPTLSMGTFEICLPLPFNTTALQMHTHVCQCVCVCGVHPWYMYI